MKSILANDPEYTVKTALMPQSMGHATTKIRFEGDENLTISRLVSAAVPALLEDMRTIQVAPGHRADSMSIYLGTSSAAVEIMLDIPRLWWGLASDGSTPIEWTDRPLEMTRSEFCKLVHSDVGISLLSKKLCEIAQS